MSAPTYDDRARKAAIAELAAGPLDVDTLAARLADAGMLDEALDLDSGELADEVDELLSGTDDFWSTDEGLYASSAVMLDGICLTHRITRSEIESGALCMTPDLVGIDFDDSSGLAFEGGGRIACEYPFDGAPGLDEHGSFVGPEGWLSSYSEGNLLFVRRTGRMISLQAAPSVSSGDVELQALRAAFEATYVDGVAVEPIELLMDALCRDPALFRTPVLPLGDLLRACGLEPNGAWWGPIGAGARPPGALFVERERRRRVRLWGFASCCESAFDVVIEAWRAMLSSSSGPVPSRILARSLSHEYVAPAFADFVMCDDDEGSKLLVTFATELLDFSGKDSAGGHFLRALEFERTGSIQLADEELHAATLADPEFAPALAELSRYASYRGHAELAVSLLRRAGVSDDDAELSYVASRVSALPAGVGRNDPCPCGSGRKLKSCCIRGAATSIESRASWLYHKIIGNVSRPPARLCVEEMVAMAYERLDREVKSHLVSLFVDLVAFDFEVLTRFLGVEGLLLPADELELASSWLGTTMRLWHVLSVDPGQSISLRDVTSGETSFVIERSGSKQILEGDYVLARVVPVGGESGLMSQAMILASYQRASALAMLDADPTTWDVAAWLIAANAPPKAANHEGHELIVCHAILRPLGFAWNDVMSSLDERFESQGDDEWADIAEIGGESIVRSFLRRDGDALTIDTNSVERLDGLYEALQEIGIDYEVLEDHRLAPAEAALAYRADDSSSSDAQTDPSPEMLAQVHAYMRERERAWLDEQILALGGLTPREAADDPTRREDLRALLNEFKSHGNALPDSTAGFDLDFLSRELGMD
jgi:hypothetical protein